MSEKAVHECLRRSFNDLLSKSAALREDDLRHARVVELFNKAERDLWHEIEKVAIDRQRLCEDIEHLKNDCKYLTEIVEGITAAIEFDSKSGSLIDAVKILFTQRNELLSATDAKTQVKDRSAVREPLARPTLSIADFLLLSKQLKGNARLWLWFATLTGATYNELHQLRLSDCNLDRLTVALGPIKIGHQRVIPLHPKLAEVIRRRSLKPDQPILRPWRMHEGSLGVACKIAGLPYRIRFKDLRGTFARWAQELGIPSLDIQRLLLGAQGGEHLAYREQLALMGVK